MSVARTISLAEAESQIPGVAADGSLYAIGKMQAHVTGVLHLAISVFIFDGDHLLIQQRALGKYHCGGQWANTCCSHPHWGEATDDAAARRLREELGFTVPLLPQRFVDYRASVGGGLVEHERVHLFVGSADRHSLTVRPDPDEVADTRWVTLPALQAEIAAAPERFTPWFRIYLERFPDLRFGVN